MPVLAPTVRSVIFIVQSDMKFVLIVFTVRDPVLIFVNELIKLPRLRIVLCSERLDIYPSLPIPAAVDVIVA